MMGFGSLLVPLKMLFVSLLIIGSILTFFGSSGRWLPTTSTFSQVHSRPCVNGLASRSFQCRFNVIHTLTTIKSPFSFFFHERIFLSLQPIFALKVCWTFLKACKGLIWDILEPSKCILRYVKLYIMPCDRFDKFTAGYSVFAWILAYFLVNL